MVIRIQIVKFNVFFYVFSTVYTLSNLLIESVKTRILDRSKYFLWRTSTDLWLDKYDCLFNIFQMIATINVLNITIIFYSRFLISKCIEKWSVRHSNHTF